MHLMRILARDFQQPFYISRLEFADLSVLQDISDDIMFVCELFQDIG